MIITLFCRSFGGNELASKRRRPEDLKIGEGLIVDQKLDLAIINCQSTYVKGGISTSCLKDQHILTE